MPTVRRSSLNDVMAAAARALVAKLPIDASRVKQVARPGGKVPTFDGDQDIVLRWRGWRVAKGHETRVDYRQYRRLEVILRTRSELDESGLDVAWLTDAVSGEVVFEEGVLNVLHGDYLYDESGNALTDEALAAVEGGDYDRVQSVGWGQVSTFFDVLVSPPLDVTEYTNRSG